MASKRQRKKLGEEHLQRIIDLCKSVEERGLDPFLVDVKDIIAVVREYFPEWELPEELCLDAEAIHHLASVIKLQSEWVKHRSTSLYTDPFLLEEKIRRLDREKIANIFLKAWHPIIELEQISPHSLTEAIKYWQSLLPLSERWLKIASLKTETGAASPEELIKQRILAEKAFSEELETFWEELKQRVSEEGKIRYWDFIGADTYPETVRRAYMTSFLLTYGYATLEIFPLEEEMYIKLLEKPVSAFGKGQAVSIPVSISYEDWLRYVRERGKRESPSI
ncbi:MAG: hypothetical protein AOA65_0080 [Candidatus Bathyarchaeota archaeon BA1]|nr:MAG: hypothetical protein AOA65_0080 [Candidatus Bathyarchaeota archaeon BA1]